MPFVVTWRYCDGPYRIDTLKGAWSWSLEQWIEKAARTHFEQQGWTQEEIEVTVADLLQFGDWEVVSVTFLL
mgnify:CR=1 FL=1